MLLTFFRQIRVREIGTVRLLYDTVDIPQHPLCLKESHHAWYNHPSVAERLTQDRLIDDLVIGIKDSVEKRSAMCRRLPPQTTAR
jgi:hypothetical protein